MATSLNTALAAREIGYQQKQYLCGRHTLTGADTPAYTKIGRLPSGSVVTAVEAVKVTAVTGGTPVLGVGTSTSTVGTNGNIQNVMLETAGTERVTPLAAYVMPLTAPTDVYVGTTGAATAGDVIVIVEFITPLS